MFDILVATPVDGRRRKVDDPQFRRAEPVLELRRCSVSGEVQLLGQDRNLVLIVCRCDGHAALHFKEALLRIFGQVERAIEQQIVAARDRRGDGNLAEAGGKQRLGGLQCGQCCQADGMTAPGS